MADSPWSARQIDTVKHNSTGSPQLGCHADAVTARAEWVCAVSIASAAQGGSPPAWGVAAPGFITAGSKAGAAGGSCDVVVGARGVGDTRGNRGAIGVGWASSSLRIARRGDAKNSRGLHATAEGYLSNAAPLVEALLANATDAEGGRVGTGSAQGGKLSPS